MSKRFGRRQKRKMAQRIADLELAQNMDSELLKSMSQRLESQSRIISDTMEVLGRNFITLPADEIELIRLRDLGDMWREIISKCHFKPGWSEINERFLPEMIDEIRCLPVMKCEAFLDDIRSATHYRFTFNGKTAGYAISQSTIMQNPGFKEAARKNVGEAVMRLFMDAQ